MKKIFIFLIIVLIIVAIVGFNYILYKNEYNTIQSENAEFSNYKDKEIYGLEVATIINKATDRNNKNKLSKNDEDYLNIDIYMTDNEKTYQMESIYNAGTEQFVQYYKDIKFKCTKVEYNEKTNKIKYMLFEQQQIS